MPDEHTQALVVGGGLVGLSMAMFLRVHGVQTVLIERHPGTAIHPRTPAYNPRTMELFRAAGIEESIRAADQWDTDNTGVLWVETLAGKELGWLDPPEMKGTTHDFSDLSPTTWKICRQDRLEPVLRQRAEELGASVRFDTRMTSWQSDADGVTAVLEQGGGPARTVRAEYLIAADGTASPIRESLGIDLAGRGALDHRVSIWFRADLTEARRGRGIVLCVVRHPELSATLRVTNDLCSLTVSYDPEQGESPADFDEQRCVRLIRTAIGIPDLDVEVTNVTPWSLSAGVARRYRQNRVLLVGDAAHVMPPAGAFGANTGIHDAHNLAWKLALVLADRAGSGLLDSYERERRPIAQLTVDETVARWFHWYAQDRTDPDVPDELADDLSLIFGYRYRSSAVRGIAEDEELLVDPRQSAALPGLRLPHVALRRDGDSVSTVDLCGPGFTLFTDADDASWPDAARQVADRLGVTLTCYRIGPDGELTDVEGRWSALHGGAGPAALLVRPDGFVCWRAHDVPSNREQALEDALRAVLNVVDA